MKKKEKRAFHNAIEKNFKHHTFLINNRNRKFQIPEKYTTETLLTARLNTHGSLIFQKDLRVRWSLECFASISL